VYPSEVEAVVVLADVAVGPQYAMVVDARATLPRLVVCCEPSAPGVDGLEVGARLHDALARRLGLGCEVRVVEPGTLPRTEVGKARRVVRWETGPAPLPGLE
jgi:phenylacetate-CoA ligase